jgi:hypothetical protein
MDPRYLSRVDGHALVLGGSGGIGREIVRALVASFAARTVAERMRRNGIKDAIVLITSDNATVSWSPISVCHWDDGHRQRRIPIAHRMALAARYFAVTASFAIPLIGARSLRRPWISANVGAGSKAVSARSPGE